MLRGSRSIIIALGLAFCIFFASGGAYWLFSSASSLQARYEQAAKNRSHNYAQRRDIIIKDRCSPLAGTDKAKCINEEREAAREGDRKEYGLEAQRITAAWTAHMGIAAIIGMVASLIGVGLVWTTFHETRIANIIALPDLVYSPRP